jgi:RpiR family transcriptional regulator, carbohydrate utilization regulator
MMLERIRASIPALPPAEQRVAGCCWPTRAASPACRWANWPHRSHVSKPTVVRFCRSIGYDGLADFKLKLAGSVNEGVPFVHRAVDDDDKAGDIVVKVIDNAVAALLRYRNAAAGQASNAPSRRWPKPAARARAHRVLRRRQLRHRGAGRAAQVLPPGRQRAMAVSDGHVQVMSATMLKPGDVAVIISNSGRSRDLLDVAEIARRKGATVIAITASGSPLALRGADGRQRPAGGRPPRRRRPLQPDGVAPAAPADHRHPDHRRGAAPGLGAAAAAAAGDQEEPARRYVRRVTGAGADASRGGRRRPSSSATP